MHKIYIIELCNFEDYPPGGHLSFAKQMIKAYGDQIALVGISTGSELTRKWIKKKIEGIEYDFFSIKKTRKDFIKPLIPNRLKSFYYLSRCHKQLKFLKNENVFIQTPEVLFAIRNWGIKNICFRSPGVSNMLEASRYFYSKFFKRIYEFLFFFYLRKVNTILASADKKAIGEFCSRSKNRISLDSVIQFPTRIDTSIFVKRQDQREIRKILSLPQEIKLIITTGRLNKYKGWGFLIDSFKKFHNELPESKFIIVGDGEDRYLAEKYTREKGLEKDILFTGNLKTELVGSYLNACDLFVMGSFIEGWSTSLMEAIACEIPVCVTNFGAAQDLVENGKNGFVCLDHDIINFVDKMKQALLLTSGKKTIKAQDITKYSVANLRYDLESHWKVG